MYENVKKNGYEKFDHRGTLRSKIKLPAMLILAVILRTERK